MTYIIILNWKGALDTIACLKTVFQLQGAPFCIIICDNASPDNSYNIIRDWLIENRLNFEHLANHRLVELGREAAEKYRNKDSQNEIYLIQTGDNLGYAGGNNVGIRLAINQPGMRYVWLLNNDTEVEPDSLYHLVARCEQNPKIGICGSRLIYHHDRAKLQGLGGIYNPWLCTTKHYAAFEDSKKKFNNDETEKNIDYIIGASMLLTRPLLEKVGLLEEGYFIYYEELDIAHRAKKLFKLGSASESIVFHKEGASTNAGKSEIADYFSIKNRILFTKLNNNKFLPFVRASLVLVALNRAIRKNHLGVRIALKMLFSKAQKHPTKKSQNI